MPQKTEIPRHIETAKGNRPLTSPDRKELEQKLLQNNPQQAGSSNENKTLRTRFEEIKTKAAVKFIDRSERRKANQIDPYIIPKKNAIGQYEITKFDPYKAQDKLQKDRQNRSQGK